MKALTELTNENQMLDFEFKKKMERRGFSLQGLLSIRRKWSLRKKKQVSKIVRMASIFFIFYPYYYLDNKARALMLSPLLGHKVQTLRTLTLHCLRFPNAARTVCLSSCATECRAIGPLKTCDKGVGIL